MLTAFLTPYTIHTPIPSEQERRWRRLIHSTEDVSLNSPFRFVYFSIKQTQFDAMLLKDVLHDFFGKPVPIVWLNDHEGLKIDEQVNEREDISFEELIDILMSDLYVTIKLFVGPFKHRREEVNPYYHSVIRDAAHVFSISDKRVVTYVDAIPFLLISQLAQQQSNEMVESVPQEFLEDKETLSMLETFFYCNLNSSETAKVLHLHRNSLQYRLDRFVEKTGIDVREFQQALTVYLAILSLKES